jgi:hypothetical protein
MLQKKERGLLPRRFASQQPITTRIRAIKRRVCISALTPGKAKNPIKQSAKK